MDIFIDNKNKNKTLTNKKTIPDLYAIHENILLYNKTSCIPYFFSTNKYGFCTI